MSTDIVERLRAPDNALLLLEAADEIDRLRHLVDALGRALAVAEGTEVEELRP